MTNHSNIIELTEKNFDAEVLQRLDIPVAVEFWAPWCSTFRAAAPVVEAVAEDFYRRVQVAKVNMDASQTLADRYDVRALPTMVLFNRGGVVGRNTGCVPRQTLNAAFDTLTCQSEPVED